ncbi:MAG: hydrolase, partial [Burkholderiales bacterium]
MRFVTFAKRGRAVAGVISESGEEVIDLSVAVPRLADLNAIIEGGGRALDQVRAALRTRKQGARRPRKGVRLMAPIPVPRRNIFCVGKNYHEHAKEFHSSGFDASAGKAAIPEYPIIFSKSWTTVIGPGEP